LLIFGGNVGVMNTENIKRWLKDIGKNRDWLAQHCGVSKSTVDGWMAGRPLPKPSMNIITGLMFKDRPLAPKFTPEEFEKMVQAAKAEGMSMDEWVAKAVVDALDRQRGVRPARKEAEEEVSFRVPRKSSPK